MHDATHFLESYLFWGIVLYWKQLNHYGEMKFAHYNVVHTIMSNNNRHTSVIASFQYNPISLEWHTHTQKHLVRRMEGRNTHTHKSKQCQ